MLLQIKVKYFKGFKSWIAFGCKVAEKSEKEQQTSQHQNQPPLKKRQMCWFWCEADVDCRPAENPKPRFHSISF